jgi:hypothetical protein
VRGGQSFGGQGQAQSRQELLRGAGSQAQGPPWAKGEGRVQVRVRATVGGISPRPTHSHFSATPTLLTAVPIPAKNPFFFFFCGMGTCKAAALLLEPHLQSIYFALVVLEMGVS